MILNGLKTNIFEESIMASKTSPAPQPEQSNDRDFTPFQTFPFVEKKHTTEWLYFKKKENLFSRVMNQQQRVSESFNH